MTLWYSKHLYLRLCWRQFLLGVLGPHAGMRVWVFHVGPLSLEYWPSACDPDLF
jgi:hypothetical protein